MKIPPPKGRLRVSLAGWLVLAALFSGCVSTSTVLVDLSRIEPGSTPREVKRYERFIRRYSPSEDAFLALERIAEPYIRQRQWDKAAQVYKKFRPRFKVNWTSPSEVMDGRFEKIISLLEAPLESLSVTNLGPGINTSALEALPVPTADGRYLYFTGKDRPDCLGGEDVFISMFEEGEWQKAKNLGSRVNTWTNESANSVSADGTRLILLGNYSESFGSGDNFYVDKIAQGWGKVQHFPRPINSIYFDSDGFITSDGKAILFTSDRPGNLGEFHKKDERFHGNFWGNTDIYVSLLTDSGWGEPVNLGPAINTPFAERTPFLHPDGKTLYFSSDGHYGLGRLDVFKSVRLSDTSWTAWSEPVNLGKEINTAGDDWGYKITTKGDLAYFSAYGGAKGYGRYDVYAITLPAEARPQAVATIRGRVRDEKGNPLAAAIKWENLKTGANVGELRSDPQDGSYFIVLPLGANYGYYAEREGYYPISKNIDLENKIQAVEITEDIVLVSIAEIKEKGTPVRINNIFFDFDRYSLRSESYPELRRLASFLGANPEAKVEIRGHTDNIGTEEYNLELSRKRAQSVVSYLVSQGCNPANLTPEGYGETEPLASNETEEGRALNRRVEFRFVK